MPQAQWKGIVGTGFKPREFEDHVRRLTFGLWKPQFAVLHNTGRPKLTEWHSTAGAQRMLNLTHYYRDQQSWSAGPHLFIADDLIWVFTPLTTSGRHSPSWNAVSWGIEMVGDYDVEDFGKEVRSNAVAALTTLHAAAGLAPETLRLHKEDPLTTHKNCPGRNVNKVDMIGRVRDALLKRYAGEHGPGARQ